MENDLRVSSRRPEVEGTERRNPFQRQPVDLIVSSRRPEVEGTESEIEEDIRSIYFSFIA